MKPDAAELMAYVDGELDQAGIARVEAAMAADPGVAAAVQAERRLRDQLRAAFDPVLDEPVPAHLQALARGDVATSLSPAPVRELPRRNKPRLALPEWAALAAALALGIAISQFALAPAAAPLEVRDGQLVADGELADSLESGLAAESGEALRIGISFRDGSGTYCRSFRLHGARDLDGLACRDPQGRWQVPVLVGSEASPRGGLRQASGSLPAAVLAEMQARIAGEPLDAGQERAARDAGWR
ncbi:anti-sigma factor [Arenimonas sp.]|uniref:anti-sigma factor family protein n=1 Tax=Arenimonas sp. TaxID=1872635 RepID=UPI0035B49AAC